MDRSNAAVPGEHATSARATGLGAIYDSQMASCKNKLLTSNQQANIIAGMNERSRACVRGCVYVSSLLHEKWYKLSLYT